MVASLFSVYTKLDTIKIFLRQICFNLKVTEQQCLKQIEIDEKFGDLSEKKIEKKSK